MTKPIIAIDIDEVLSASAPDFVAFSNERWGTHLKVEDYTEHWAEMWQVDIDEAGKRREIFLESGLISRYRPVETAADALKELQRDYDIVLVTSRSTALESETIAWIETHYSGIAKSVHFSGIYDGGLAANMVARTKSDIFAELKPVFVIDDHLKHCQAAADLGIPAILFGDYAWNKEYEGNNDLIVRCHDWNQSLEFITSATKR